MKVVILCGGKGTRFREYPEEIPKPLALIGGKPILWHIMKIYAHYGFRDFVLCLGYRGDMIKKYFLPFFKKQYPQSLTDTSQLSEENTELDIPVEPLKVKEVVSQQESQNTFISDNFIPTPILDVDNSNARYPYKFNEHDLVSTLSLNLLYKEELQVLCQELGLSSTGRVRELRDRIDSVLIQ